MIFYIPLWKNLLEEQCECWFCSVELWSPTSLTCHGVISGTETSMNQSPQESLEPVSNKKLSLINCIMCTCIIFLLIHSHFLLSLINLFHSDSAHSQFFWFQIFWCSLIYMRVCSAETKNKRTFWGRIKILQVSYDPFLVFVTELVDYQKKSTDRHQPFLLTCPSPSRRQGNCTECHEAPLAVSLVQKACQTATNLAQVLWESLIDFWFCCKIKFDSQTIHLVLYTYIH